MLRDFFGNITPVVRNLLFLNIALFVFIVTGGMNEFGQFINNDFLGLYYPAFPEFKPYQIVSHMFAHGSGSHILFNMFALVMFGSMLERLWGGKRFLIFYLITGFGAALCHELVVGYRIHEITGQFFPEIPEGVGGHVVGASGAIYGVLAAFALLFPNTELMLLFFPVPVKAKYFIPVMMAIEFVSGMQNTMGDNVAHFAHLGGALFGFILVKIWQRNRSNFY